MNRFSANIIQLRKKSGHTYSFIYRPGDRARLIAATRRLALDKSAEFNWWDMFKVITRAMELEEQVA